MSRRVGHRLDRFYKAISIKNRRIGRRNARVIIRRRRGIIGRPISGGRSFRKKRGSGKQKICAATIRAIAQPIVVVRIYRDIVLLVGWRNRRREPRVYTIDPQMTFLLTQTTQNRTRTIAGLVAETLTIKTDTVGTNITEVTRTITFTTCRDLTTMLYKHLELTKPEEAGDRFRNSYTVMSETIIDVRGQ